MSRSLYELAAEYDTAIAAMEECAAKIKMERKLAFAKGDADSIKKITAKLYVVYEEIRDMKLIAQSLRHYYDDDEKSEVCA